MPEPIALAETAGTISSLFVSGAIFAFSTGGVSTARLAAKSSPVLAARQWLHVFTRCHNIGTPMVVASAGCFAWLKYQTNNNIYLAAAASCIGLVPYTILFLSGPEKILFAAAKVSETRADPVLRDVEQALGRWGVVNAIRVVFPLAAGVMVLASKMLWA
ncbi:hypothetical protein BJX96DRAFT_174851 [Aspergillus floccosus]